MFKFMRKSKSMRNFIIVVVVLALASYVLFSFGESPATVQGDTIAELGDVRIKHRDLLIQSANTRNQFRGINEQMLNNFVTSNLINDAAILNGVRQVGIRVSDEELRDYIINIRTTEDGGFLSEEQWAENIRYLYRLQVETFEEYLRDRGLAADKFRQMFADSTYVSQAEIEERFVKDNQKVQLEMVAVSTGTITGDIQLEDADLLAFFNQNKELFQSGDRRKARYVAFNPIQYNAEVQVSDQDVQAHYNKNIASFQQQEEVQASHILIKTDNMSEQDALKKITDIKAEIDGGLDFGEAAKKYSDDGSAAQGGDLGFFGKGRMVPPFEAAAFSSPIGQVTEPIKSQFGYHLIKVTAKKEPRTRPLSEVRTQIEQTLKREGSKGVAQDKAAEFAAKVQSGTDFEAAAAEAGLPVKMTEFFDNDPRSQIDSELRSSPQFRRETFALSELGDVSGVVDMGSKLVVLQWVDQGEPDTLDFEPNKARIRSIAQQEKAKEKINNAFAAIEKAVAADPEKSFKDFQAEYDFLKDYHFVESALFGPDSIPSQLSRELDFEKDLYAHEEGAILKDLPGNTENMLVLARIKSKSEADMDKLAEQRPDIANQLRQEKGGQLLAAYVYHQLEKYDPEDRSQNRVLNALSNR